MKTYPLVIAVTCAKSLSSEMACNKSLEMGALPNPLSVIAPVGFLADYDLGSRHRIPHKLLGL
jgi:hypothetical protein